MDEKEAMKRDIELAKKVQKTLERNQDLNTRRIPDGGPTGKLADK